MSVTTLSAVAFLMAVLVLAEFVWLREEAEERARALSDDGASRPASIPHPAAFVSHRAATSSAARPEGSA